MLSFLNPHPDLRITLDEAIEHGWLRDASMKTLPLIPVPNFFSEDELESHILEHMVANMKLNKEDILTALMRNR